MTRLEDLEARIEALEEKSVKVKLTKVESDYQAAMARLLDVEGRLAEHDATVDARHGAYVLASEQDILALYKAVRAELGQDFHVPVLDRALRARREEKHKAMGAGTGRIGNGSSGKGPVAKVEAAG